MELSGVSLPKEIATPAKLKKYLQIQRNEKIDYLLIPKIQKLFTNISISVIGDFTTCSEYKNLNICLKLINGHYTLANNENRNHVLGVHFKPVKDDDIWIYTRCIDNTYTICNGCIRRKIDFKTYHEMKTNYKYLLMKSETDDLYEDYADFMHKSRTMAILSDNFIDMKKYRSYTLAAVDTWRRLSKLYNFSSPIDNAEGHLLQKSFLGGLMYAEKNYKGFGVSYDINSLYPAMMVKNEFQIPIEPGEFKTLTKKEFHDLKYFQYGIYHCKISQSECKIFRTNKRNYYTHYDLTRAKELGLQMEIVEDNNSNFYYYSSKKLVKGKYLFGQFVEKLYDLKKQDKCFKKILTCLWGSLTEKNVYKKIVYNNDDSIFVVPDEAELLEFVPVNSGNKVKYLSDKTKLYKHPEARLGGFLTAYSRMFVSRQLQPHESKIVRIHTDGVIFSEDVKTDFKIDKELGNWKQEYKQNIEIEHVNCVKILEYF